MKVKNTMKFCINCTHYVCKAGASSQFGKCARKATINPVDGSSFDYESLPYCSVERKDYETQDTCRVEAKFYVEKETANV